MTLVKEFRSIVWISIPAILTIALLDAAIVTGIVHMGWADGSRLVLILLRDFGWNVLVLGCLMVGLATGGALVSRLLGEALGLDANRIALLIASGTGAFLGTVGLHHFLEASLANAVTRTLALGGFGTWVVGVVVVGLFRARPVVGWGRPVAAAVLVVICPLLLSAGVDAVDTGGEGAPRGRTVVGGDALVDTIVLVTLDTTRFDAVGYSGSGRTRTPVFDRLARSGAAYLQATTPTPLTLPSHTSMMTGRTPWEHGVVVNGARVPSEVPVLAEMLSAGGWRTGAFVSAPVVEAETGLARGFEVFDGVRSTSRLPSKAMVTTRIMRRFGLYRYPHVRPGRVATDAALAWLAAEDGRPEFLWLHLFDSHAPYEASAPETCAHRHRLARLPPGRAAEYDRSQRAPDWYADHMHELYDREVEGMDRQLGRIVEGLERDGRLEDTMIIVIADHGESFEAPRRFDHAATLTDQTIRIPLILHFPGIVDAGVRPRELVSVEDVYATVLEAAGLLDEEAVASSASLLVPFLRPLDAAPRSFTRHETFPHPMASRGDRLVAARNGRSMLVLSPEREGRAFFHLDEQDGRDRVGNTDRIDELATLAIGLESGKASTQKKQVADLDLIESRETMEMLRSLGYVN